MDMMPIAVADVKFDLDRTSKAVCEHYFKMAKDLRMQMEDMKGDMPPRLFYRNDEHEYMVACEKFLDKPENKDHLSDMMRTIAVKTGALAYAFATEAWTVQYDKDAGPVDKLIPPSKSPNRVEVLMCTAQYQGQPTAMMQAQIVRGKDGKVERLVEIDRIREFGGGAGSVEGRFVNVLGYPSNYKRGVLYCGKNPVEGEKVPADAKQLMIGDKVGMYLSVGKDSVQFIGYGMFDGEHPVQTPHSVHPAIEDEKFDKSKTVTFAKLDRKRGREEDDIIWGCEVIWGSEDRVKEAIAGCRVIKASIETERLKTLRKEAKEMTEEQFDHYTGEISAALAIQITGTRKKLELVVGEDRVDHMTITAATNALMILIAGAIASRQRTDPEKLFGMHIQICKDLESEINRILKNWLGDMPFKIDISTKMESAIESLKNNFKRGER